MEGDNSHADIQRSLDKNAKLLEENNQILKKIHRQNLITLWVRIAWYVLLIGLPFALYFYILEPYFEAFGSSFEVFSAGIQEIPGWKILNQGLDPNQN